MLYDSLEAINLEDFLKNADAIIALIDEKDISVLYIGTDSVKHFICSPTFLSYFFFHTQGFYVTIKENKNKESHYDS